MKLYDFAPSPNARKVRSVVYELGVTLEIVPIDLFHGGSHAPAFLAKNPNGRIPVLEDGDFVLWESTAILHYLARGSALVPAAPRANADMHRWLAWQVAHLGPAMSKVGFERVVKRYTNRGAPDQARIAEGTAEFAQLIQIFDAAIADREYVAGTLSPPAS